MLAYAFTRLLYHRHGECIPHRTFSIEPTQEIDLCSAKKHNNNIMQRLKKAAAGAEERQRK